MSEDDRKGVGGAPKGDEKDQISPRLPLALIDRLRKAAERNKRTMSGEVEYALERYLDQDERRAEKAGS